MNIFLDCGTHLFQGFEEFSNIYKIDPSWKSFCFEANPLTYELSKKKYVNLLNSGYKIEHYNFAISDRYDELEIHCAMSPENTGFTNQGSNILCSPPLIDKVYGGIFDYEKNSRLVRTIDFSDFIDKNCEDDDFVLVKMDIEGSEFHVLDRLIHTGAIKKINEIYVEFHERFFDNVDYYTNKKNSFKQMFDYYGTKFHEWR